MAAEVKAFPKKPIIRKLGTISCNNIVETTPIVFKGELYRFEVVRRKSFTSETAANIYWRDIDEPPCLRFVHVKTNTSTPTFADNHCFGCPYVIGDTMYVVTGVGKDWGTDRLVFLKSKDLINWEKHSELHLPDWKIYNMYIAEKDGLYTLAVEINGPREACGGMNWALRFLTSPDLTDWTLLPVDHIFNMGAPSLYTFEGDPYYYLLHIEFYPHHHFPTCISRSKDLINWEYSVANPVLMYDDAEDKKIGNPFLTPADRERIDKALNINNSDMEICEYLGRTVIYYSWGDQKGNEFLAEACAECGMHDFLKSFFEA